MKEIANYQHAYKYQAVYFYIYFEIGLKLWVEVGALQATVKKPEGYSD